MADDKDNDLGSSPEDAKRRGLKYYFTGRPCKRGHVSKRTAKGASCMQCACVREKERRLANPDRAKEVDRRHHAKNKEKNNRHSKSYHAKNRDNCLGRMRRWHAKNKQKANARAKAWRAKNPDSVNLYNHRRKARIRGHGGTFTSADIAAIKRLQNGKCAFFSHCGQQLMIGKKRNYQIDHIKPLFRGGTHDRANLQLLCPGCNLSKHDRDPIDHMQSLGFLL